MKKLLLVIVVMLFSIFLVSPGMANETMGRYGYIQVDSAAIDVIDLDEAVFNVSYRVDDNVDFLVILLGKNDLKDKLCDIFDLDNCRFETVGMDHARFFSDIHSYNYGEGTYWFPERNFRTEIPNLTIKAQDSFKEFDSVQEFPGIGYFYENP